MADKIIKISIDVSKLKKEWLFQGEKGKYANITLLYNEVQDTYGNNGMVVQDVPKAIYEKDKTVKGNILGNAKEFSKGSGAPEVKPGQEPNLPTGAADDDDLPF
jgi:hypothetical protein